ncbi:MAG: rod shape-determining protein MreC [Sphingobacteriia bacterium]|nr:rod shape-determining protein MreC [Sphingobacteriia bacterium]
MQNLFAFIWKYSFYFLFLLLMVISFLLMIQNNYYQKTIVINTTNGVTGKLLTVVSNITDYFSLRHANKSLAQENARLLSENCEPYIFLSRNDSLFTDTSFAITYHYEAARVISNSVNRRNNYLKINKGRVHGILPDMAVISPDGVVGHVIETSAHFSSVMSALNKNSRISAKHKKSNQSGSLLWEGGNYRLGKLIDIPSHVQIQTGDTIVTSGYSHVYPEGMLIGTVEDFRLEEGENFYQLVVRFSVDFNKLSYVYVVSNPSIHELKELHEPEVQN